MIKNPYKGRLISLDGLDGSGLSTQAGLLKWYLEKQGIEVFSTHYPTEKSAYSAKIQQVMNNEIEMDTYEFHSLMAKDRHEDFKNWITPSLKRGKWVISDHYVFASLAFGPQGTEELEKYEELNKEFFLPDLGIVLMVKPETSLERITQRGKKVQVYENLKRLQMAWNNFQGLLNKYDCLREVNGEQIIEKVHEDIKSIVKEVLLDK